MNDGNNIHKLGSNVVLDNNVVLSSIDYLKIVEVINEKFSDEYLSNLNMNNSMINQLYFDAAKLTRVVGRELINNNGPFSISKKKIENSAGTSLGLDFETFKYNVKASVNEDVFSSCKEPLNVFRRSYQQALSSLTKKVNNPLMPYDYDKVMNGINYSSLLSADNVKRNPANAIDLRHELSNKKVSFDRAIVDEGRFSQSNLITNKVTLAYNYEEIKAELDDILYEYYDNEYRGSDQDDILDAFEDGGDNNIKDTLIDFIENQNKGCIGRNLSYLSLKFAYDSLIQMDLKFKDKENADVLRKYISLFELFEKFIADMISNNEFCELGIPYKSTEAPDFINLLRKNNIYDCLPYIGRVNNNFSFGEYGGTIKRNIGISFKMNQKVESSKTFELGKSSFNSSLEYHLRIIKVAATETLRRFVSKGKNTETTDLIDALIKAVILKFFLLGITYDEYDSVANLMTDLNIIRKSCKNIEGVKTCLKLFDKQLESALKPMNAKLEALAAALELSIFNCFGTGKRNPKEYSRDFLIFKSFLPANPMDELLSQTASESRAKKIGDTCMVPEGTEIDGVLCRINFKFNIETVSYMESGEDISGVFDVCEDKYLNFNLCYIPYDYLEDTNKMHRTRYLSIPGNTTFYITYIASDNFYSNGVYAFLFETIYRIITSVAVESTIFWANYRVASYNKNLDSQNLKGNKKLSVSQVRLHDWGKQLNSKSNGFIRRLSKEIDFAIGETCEINSQGFDFNVAPGQVAMRHDNSVASLYSKKEKIFKLSKNLGVKKYAIVSVTSTITDDARSSSGQPLKDYNLVSVLGNITKIDVKNDVVNIIDGFNFKYSKPLCEVYSTAFDLRDKINELVSEGYTDIVYVANAPDTQKMSLSRESGENLYFFNEAILKEILLENSSEFNLYPLFVAFDSGYDYRPMKTPLYLTVNDDSDRGIVPVFSVYAGAQVNKRSRYTSLINYYGLKDIYTESYINAKLSKCFKDYKKSELALVMYLYHTSKQEKIDRKPIVPKVNPYEDLIGVEGIGKISSVSYNIEEVVNNARVGGTLNSNGLVLTNSIIDNSRFGRETDRRKDKANG